MPVVISALLHSGRGIIWSGDAVNVRDGVEQAVRAKTNLAYANLYGTNLKGADLTGACLRNACLRFVDLSGACLRDAILSGIDRHGANFTGADLTCAVGYMDDGTSPRSVLTTALNHHRAAWPSRIKEDLEELGFDIRSMSDDDTYKLVRSLITPHT